MFEFGARKIDVSNVRCSRAWENVIQTIRVRV